MTLKVLCIDPAGNLWGSEQVLLDMLPVLERFTPAVCCPPRSPLHRELRRRGVTVLPFYVANLHKRSKAARGLACLGVLASCIAWRPDIIYLNQSGCYKIVLVVARLIRIPVVAHVRIFEDAAYLARQRPTRSRLHGLVAISNAIANEIREHAELAAIPLRMVYDGYAPRRQAPGCSSQPRKGKSLACVGRIVPIKAHDLLLETLALLLKRIPDVTCSILGTGDGLERDLKVTAQVLGLGRCVQWLGFVSDPHRVLEVTELLLLPSHREPLGRVIFEAWDAGCLPVVYAGSGGAAEAITASGGGLIYPVQSADAMASTIAEALALSPAQRDAYIARGRRWMEEHCSARSYGSRMEDVFMEALAIGA